MNHVFHPDAALEFEEAVRYYRARGRVLGDRFAAEVRLAIQRILETPECWSRRCGGVWCECFPTASSTRLNEISS